MREALEQAAADAVLLDQMDAVAGQPKAERSKLPRRSTPCNTDRIRFVT